MLMSYVLDSTATRHNLDAMAKFYLNYETTTYEEVAGKGVKQITFNQVDLEAGSDYAAEDADITFRCYELLKDKLAETPKLEKVLTEIDLPMIKVLSEVEQNGALVDSDILRIQSNNLGQRINGLEEQAFGVAGKEFNLASTKDLRQIFFEEMNLPVIKKTPGGQPSTDESVLQDLAREYELPKILLEHRTLAKLKSTYTDSLPEQISTKTGRVHTSYHQAVTSTGRLSSADPNLQNIPIKSEEGRMIRNAFIAPKGFKLLAVDYSQIELRIMAHLSKDEGMIGAFEKGEDIHAATAAPRRILHAEELVPHKRTQRAACISSHRRCALVGISKAAQIAIHVEFSCRNDACYCLDATRWKWWHCLRRRSILIVRHVRRRVRW